MEEICRVTLSIAQDMFLKMMFPDLTLNQSRSVAWSGLCWWRACSSNQEKGGRGIFSVTEIIFEIRFARAQTLLRLKI